MLASTHLARSVRVVLVVVVALCAAQRTYADIAPRWTDEQLVGFADLVVRGRVARVEVSRDDLAGALYTSISLDVAQVLKGSIREPRITIRQLGGRLGSTALQIGGQAAFVAGEDVIVFLEERPRDRTWATTALWQGKFTIVTTGAGEVAVRQDPGGPTRGIFSDDSRVLASWIPALQGDTAPLSARVGAGSVTPAATGLATSTGRAPTTIESPLWDARMAGSVRIDSVAPGQSQLPDRGEPQLRAAADFWSSKGMGMLAAGGLQPSGCFTTREPDGRIAVGADGCGELNPRGGTIAVSGSWIRYDVDADGRTTPRFLGGGVITNRGAAATSLLAQPECFEEVAIHELGHALGLTDAPDGAGVMSPVLRCSAGASLAPLRAQTSSSSNLRPTFVPLQSSSPSNRAAVDRNTGACLVGCDLTVASATWAEPAAPTDLTFTLSGSTLTLNWSPASGGGTAEDWLIEAGSSPGATDVARFFTGSIVPGFSATVAGNAVFYIRVRGANRSFTGPASNEVVVVIGSPTVPPGPPLGLAASAAGSSVTLAWSPPATGGAVATYTIQAGSQPGATDLANFSTGSTATTFSAAGVGAGAYFVRVRASNAAGVSNPSNEVLLLVGGGCSPPVPPANLGASVNGSAVTLLWTAAAGATSYQLQVGSNSGATDLLDLDLQSASTALTAVNVGAGSYFVRVRSLNSCGRSTASNEILVVVR